VEVVASLSQGGTTAAQCGLFTHISVPVIFEPPCSYESERWTAMEFSFNFQKGKLYFHLPKGSRWPGSTLSFLFKAYSVFPCRG